MSDSMFPPIYPAPSGPTILLVEDTLPLWSAIHRSIRSLRLPYELSCVGTYEEAAEQIHSSLFDIIVCDYQLPNFRNGLELWELCRRRLPGTSFLMISGLPTDAYLRLTRGLSTPPPFLAKPFSIEELTQALQGMLSRRVSPPSRVA